MPNINKLKGMMVEKEMTAQDVAEALGMDRATFYRRLASNGNDFTIKEAKSVCDALNLNSQEALAIFFNHYVA